RLHTRFSRDWSSDVCSSDLDLPGVPGDLPGAAGAAWGDGEGEPGRPQSEGTTDVVPGRLDGAGAPGQGHGAHPAAPLPAAVARQIGRASCRERVHILVVGVS